ncbi:Helix-hairpin-helix domain-containing protein [Micromonospora viridifaciens]|uniref:Helix-hairpin-helix domain-containing protein n=1 Tax=Micromonospora viridifaciens TaxID=1881 RepID=A0A1C4YQ32_MICVI|nr:helix-hairpin-helix domain-containing protein [Micromonospora viridifaciens]SCF22747.1 Helix-hairpin-helix domain-containing protein [Micromonospora viridifaciens]
MSSSFALWLVGILTVVAGLVIWRVLAGGRTTAGPAAPIVEGEPTTATGDQERHATVVDEVAPPAAVAEEPAGLTPAEAAQPAAETVPVTVKAEPVAAEAEPSSTETEPAAAQAEPGNTETEPASAETEPVTAEVEPATPPTEPAAPAIIPAPRTSVENSTAAAAEPSAAPVAAPADGPADDFRKIQGIGPKMAAGLQAAGIRTYQQLAELDETALREVIKAAGLRAAPGLATWPQQAKVLAGASAEADKVLPAGAGGNA